MADDALNTGINSATVNSSKYFSDNYIFVANESTIERQKTGSSSQPQAPRTHSDDDWVARILEIRASDEHHVYARVYWMYWPDELPANTLDGKRHVTGRQPYHGHNELIASNHSRSCARSKEHILGTLTNLWRLVDIINVVSVTQQAIVNQVTDENDDQVQAALYWRQALDIRTLELSVSTPNDLHNGIASANKSRTQSVDRVCRCNEPGNPDKVLIGCSSDSCKKWLHEECLKHDILMKVWDELGALNPKKASDVKEEKLEQQANRPLSPVEPGSATVANELPIQVKTDGEGDTVKASGDSVDVKEERDRTTESSAQPQNGRASTTQTPSAEVPRKIGPGRGRKKPEHDLNIRPYEGKFDATFKPEEDVFEIQDLREGVEGGLRTWTEQVQCLVCGSRIC